MHLIDWIIIALYFVISLSIGLYFYKRAGGSTENFFLSGRQLAVVAGGTFDGGYNVRG